VVGSYGVPTVVTSFMGTVNIKEILVISLVNMKQKNDNKFDSN
jgi:hypothetical protein